MNKTPYVALDLLEQAVEKEKIPLTGKFHFKAERKEVWGGPWFM